MSCLLDEKVLDESGLKIKFLTQLSYTAYPILFQFKCRFRSDSNFRFRQCIQKQDRNFTLFFFSMIILITIYFKINEIKSNSVERNLRTPFAQSRNGLVRMRVFNKREIYEKRQFPSVHLENWICRRDIRDTLYEHCIIFPIEIAHGIVLQL